MLILSVIVGFFGLKKLNDYITCSRENYVLDYFFNAAQSEAKIKYELDQRLMKKMIVPASPQPSAPIGGNPDSDTDFFVPPKTG